MAGKLDKNGTMPNASIDTDGNENANSGIGGGQKMKAAESNGIHDLPAYQAHPIGPLSGTEIETSSTLIRQAWPTGTRFQFKVITLLEPAKAELIPYLDAERKGLKHRDIDRRAFVVYYLKNTVRNLVSICYWLTDLISTSYTKPWSTSLKARWKEMFDSDRTYMPTVTVTS